jgi:hypothetical protein
MRCKRCGDSKVKCGFRSNSLCIPCHYDLLILLRKLSAGLAHSKVVLAKRAGLLPQLDGSVKCVDCGHEASVYDHRDYNEPLNVEPVCHRCNKHRGSAKPIKENIGEITRIKELLGVS